MRVKALAHKGGLFALVSSNGVFVLQGQPDAVEPLIMQWRRNASMLKL